MAERSGIILRPMSQRAKNALAYVAMALLLLGLAFWVYVAFRGMKYFWDWSILFCGLFRTKDCLRPFFYWFASGLRWTMVVSLAAWVIAFSLGSLIGVARTVNQPMVRGVATAYVQLFRNVPLLVQMFLWFFVVPELLPEKVGMWVKRELPLPEYWTGIVCLGTYHAARVAEQVRAGIQSIPRGQSYAGLAMGLTGLQLHRYVLLPVSYRIIIPPLTSDFLGIFKNSSVALTIGVMEITAQSRQIGEYTFNYIETFAAATVLYLVVTFIVIVLMRIVEGKVHIPGTISMHEPAGG